MSLNEALDEFRRHIYSRQEREAVKVVEAELARLRAEIERLKTNGQYVLTCLGGAGAGGEDGWSRPSVRRLWEHLCKEYPEFDPLRRAEPKKEGGETND